jgi:hypothetical protein
MLYVKVDGGAVTYPYTVTDFKRANPGVSIRKNPADTTLTEFGLFPVTPSTVPAYDPVTQDIARSVKQRAGGEWKEVWTVTPAPDAADRVAAKREGLESTPAAFLEALLDADLLDKAEQAIAAIANAKQRRRFQIRMQSGPLIRRKGNLVAALQTALALSDEQTDALFTKE